MIKKERQRPILLKMVEALERRKGLNDKELDLKRRLTKGWQGEKLFDRMTENLPDHLLILNDLLLSHRNTTFQIDTLIISSDVVHLYEVKYYEGDYFYENNEFQLSSRKTILNPLHQLARTKTLLTQLLEDHGFFFKVEAHVIFPHPHFFLFQAPSIEEFIFLPHWKEHIHQLNQYAPPTPEYTHSLADLLCFLHKTERPPSDIPKFYYDQLKQELSCPYCFSPVHSEIRTFLCKMCGTRFPTEKVILQAVEEFQILFPDERVTTSRIHDWCKGFVSKRRIQRTLSKNLESVGTGRGIHYI